ncbi:MAG: ribbon-helix-helix protein, CopG family [Actinomycetota bacterium]
MSKRLQVLLEDKELAAIRKEARRQGLTVSELVRQAIRSASKQSSHRDPARKLAAIRAASRHSFPTGDIDQMLAEIERGYLTH